MRFSPSNLLIATMLMGLAPIGCSDSSSDDVAPVSAATSEPAYDLVAIVEGIAETLRVEIEIMSKALESWDEVDEADRLAFRTALEDRMRLGDECKAMLLAHPDWARSCCGWLLPDVVPLNTQRFPLTRRLREVAPTSSARNGTNRYGELMYGAFGSKEAAKAFFSFQADHPCSPTNLVTMCVKFGHYESTRGGFRFNAQDGE